MSIALLGVAIASLLILSDNAQQIHTLLDTPQLGLLHYETHQKCSLFEINYEPLKKHVNVLIGEAIDMAKELTMSYPMFTTSSRIVHFGSWS